MTPFLPLSAPALKVLPQHRVLHQYLLGRYADTVVLSFDQIEALLDAPLPDLAYLEEWWAPATADAAPSVQSRTWTDANRTAVPNLAARHVIFERA